MDSDTNNLAEEILGDFGNSKKKRLRGFPEQIEDGRLWNVREHLIWLVETTWDEVGCTLSGIRTLAGLRAALKPWEKRYEQEEIAVRALLRPTEKPATSKLLRRQRKQLGELHKRYLSSYEWIEKCWDSLDRFLQIPLSEVSGAEQQVICDEIVVHTRTLLHAGAECLDLKSREKELEELVKDGEAHFARTEFLRLCTNKRYSLNPSNIASALAGLPFIGYRQSARRCLKWPSEGSGGLSYQIFRAIQRIVQSSARRSELVGDAEKWLRSRRSSESFGISDLQTNWHYFRRSIKSVLDQGVKRSRLTSAISQEYWKRKTHPSHVDRAFEQDERIVN